MEKLIIASLRYHERREWNKSKLVEKILASNEYNEVYNILYDKSEKKISGVTYISAELSQTNVQDSKLKLIAKKIYQNEKIIVDRKDLYGGHSIEKQIDIETYIQKKLQNTINIIKKYEIDSGIVWGNSNESQLVYYALKYLNKKCLILEEGYFREYGIQCSLIGSNYQSEIIEKYLISLENNKEYKYDYNVVISEQNDYLELKEKKYLFIPLQINTDTQILNNSPLFNSMAIFVETFVNLIKDYNENNNDSIQIVIKPHPLWEKDDALPDYGFIKEKFSKDIIFVDNYDLNFLIDNSLGVVTINSTVGLQAVARKQKVLVLGNAIYECQNITWKVYNLKNLKQNFIEFLKAKFDDKKAANFLGFLEDIHVKLDYNAPKTKDVKKLLDILKTDPSYYVTNNNKVFKGNKNFVKVSIKKVDNNKSGKLIFNKEEILSKVNYDECLLLKLNDFKNYIDSKNLKIVNVSFVEEPKLEFNYVDNASNKLEVYLFNKPTVSSTDDSLYLKKDHNTYSNLPIYNGEKFILEAFREKLENIMQNKNYSNITFYYPTSNNDILYYKNLFPAYNFIELPNQKVNTFKEKKCWRLPERISSNFKLDKTQKTLSIIIPVYNCEKYLDDLIKNFILEPKFYKRYELIFVDDYSIDNSKSILNKFLRYEFLNIKIIYNEENYGLSTSRNRGVINAEGDYITFLDGDDFFLRNSIKLLFDYIDKEDEYDVITFGMIRPFSYGDFSINLAEKYELKGNEKNLVSYNLWSASAKLYKSSVARKVNFVRGIYFEDFEYISSLVSQKLKVLHTYIKVYAYRNTPNSIINSAFNEKKYLDYIEIFEKYKEKTPSFLYNYVVKRSYDYIVNKLLTENDIFYKEKFDNYLSENNIKDNKLNDIFNDNSLNVIEKEKKAIEFFQKN